MIKIKIEKVIFNSAEKARSFLKKLRDHIEDHDFLTIDEYYILGCIKAKGSTTYGWMRLSDVRVCSIEDKFYLEMPDPIRKW